MPKNHESGCSNGFGFGELLDFPNLMFVREFEAPGVGIFKTRFVLREFEKREPTFFQNLKFPEFHVPSIQNELILS